MEEPIGQTVVTEPANSEIPAVSILDELREKARLEAEARGPDIAGFWRRWLAFIIDGFCIAVPLLVIAIVFGELFYALGPYGRFIGYAIFIPYLAFFNSRHNSGQTLGKRITGIAVVGRDFQYLSLGQSTARAFILGLILMLNGWALPALRNPILGFLTIVIVTGGVFSMIYALVINRTTRQGIHDLLLTTYVVRTPPNTTIPLPTIPKNHRILMAGILILALLLGLAGLLFQGVSALATTILGSGGPDNTAVLEQRLIDSGDFFTVEINHTTPPTYSFPERPLPNYLSIQLWTKTPCYGNPDYCDETVDWVARLAFEHLYELEYLPGLQVILINQYDLGFLASTRTYGASLTIEEWGTRLTE